MGVTLAMREQPRPALPTAPPLQDLGPLAISPQPRWFLHLALPHRTHLRGHLVRHIRSRLTRAPCSARVLPDLLNRPRVAVGVVEEDERAVVDMVGFHAGGQLTVH